MNTTAQDTIVAIATAPHGSLSILRLSGPDSLSVCDRVFRCDGHSPSERPSHTMTLGRVVDESGRVVDTALLLIMRAPRSYTGEDVAELHCHGSSAITRSILRICLAAGCRAAGPGEFTRRAFLNGKMDLVQAEAVQNLIAAETDRSAIAALEQLEGRLSQRIESLRNGLIGALSEIEPVLDFPDDEMPEVRWDKIRDDLTRVESDLTRLLAGWHESRLLRDGIRVVFQGPPNVGKSSLFNRLIGHDRAIVSEVPGTTRDTIEESLILDGYRIRLTDTAGLRETDCEIEREGVNRSRIHGNRSDLILYTLDTTCSTDDIPALPAQGTPRIILINKSDKGGGRINPNEIATRSGSPVLNVSAQTGLGIEDLKRMILEQATGVHPSTPHAAISERHRDGLEDARERIKSAMKQIESGQESGLVLIASELRAALDALDELLGKNFRDDLLDRIFSTFCIGK